MQLLCLIMEMSIVQNPCQMNALLFIYRFEKLHMEDPNNEKATYYFGLSLAWVYLSSTNSL